MLRYRLRRPSDSLDQRGWGVRPDGFTVHASVEACRVYVEWYHATFNTASEAPDEYTTTSGNAFSVDADDAVITAVTAACGVVHGRGSRWLAGKRITAADVRVDP